jgi:hypothetical protein
VIKTKDDVRPQDPDEPARVPGVQEFGDSVDREKKKWREDGRMDDFFFSYYTHHINPHTSIYIHIHLYTSTYIHIHPHTSTYIHIHPHTSTYIQHLIRTRDKHST